MAGVIPRDNRGELASPTYQDFFEMAPLNGTRIRAIDPPIPLSIWSEPVDVEEQVMSRRPEWSDERLRSEADSVAMAIEQYPYTPFRSPPTGWRSPIGMPYSPPAATVSEVYQADDILAYDGERVGASPSYRSRAGQFLRRFRKIGRSSFSGRRPGGVPGWEK